MASSTSRRNFLLQSGKAGIGVYVGLSGSALLTACSAAKKSTKTTVSHQYDPGKIPEHPVLLFIKYKLFIFHQYKYNEKRQARPGRNVESIK